MPEWLLKYKSGDQVEFSDFMTSRVGYYPGSGYDGNLVKVGNKSHSVHCFLHVDYLIRRVELEQYLSRRNCLSGYHPIGRVDFSEQDVFPNGTYYHNPFKKKPRYGRTNFIDMQGEGYCFMEIFERNADKDETWGAERLAIVFLFADGIDTYYQLFVNQYKKAPWLFLLQDHGTGGNYSRFGKDGILNIIIKRSAIMPEYVICADWNSYIWDGYKKLGYLGTTTGGMQRWPRYLYHLERDSKRW